MPLLEDFVCIFLFFVFFGGGGPPEIISVCKIHPAIGLAGVDNFFMGLICVILSGTSLSGVGPTFELTPACASQRENMSVVWKILKGPKVLWSSSKFRRHWIMSCLGHTHVWNKFLFDIIHVHFVLWLKHLTEVDLIKVKQLTTVTMVTIPLSPDLSRTCFRFSGSAPYQKIQSSLLQESWSLTCGWSAFSDTRRHTHRMSEFIHFEYVCNTGSSRGSTTVGSADSVFHFIPQMSVCKWKVWIIFSLVGLTVYAHVV